MNPLALVFAQQGYQTFSIDPVQPLNAVALGGSALLVLSWFLRAAIAWSIYQVAADLKSKCEGPVALPPVLWGLLCFFSSGMGQVAAIGLFIFVHFSNWLDPERAWRSREVRKGLGGRHQRKVLELQEELDALRAKNRQDASS